MIVSVRVLNRAADGVRCLLGILVVAMPAFGSNLDFLHDTPFSYFNDEDMKMFSSTLSRTLSEAPDNEVRTWSNPQTNSSGKIIPLNTKPKSDQVCRDVSIVNTARGRTNKGVYTYCRREGADWKINLHRGK